ncbi:MAG: CBS domain-containing protein [Anaerolineae bacterium]|jgi:CBS domain-containing protein/anti-sigma regulatory factor (Ser/Thr protein kinase)
MEVTKLQELAYELKVGQAMTSNVITLMPAASMGEFRDVLRDHRISGTPVVADGEMVGIISIEDLIKALANGEMSATVEDKMTQDPVVIYEDEPLVHAVSRFSELSFGRLPVVDRNRELVGIITQGDIVRAMLKRLEVDYHQEEIHRYRASHIFEDIIADHITLVFGYHVEARDFQRAGEASSGLKKTLSRLGIHPHAVRRVTIATYEAEMNLAIWSEGGEITAEVQPSEIRIEVVDQGPGIPDPELAMQPGFSTATDWVREMGFGAGMGLPNIQACSDEFVLESTVGVGTRLAIVIYQATAEA